MHKISIGTPSKTSLLEVTPNLLREIANNLEKEAMSAESKESVYMPITPSLSLVYNPKAKKMENTGYGSNREEPLYVPPYFPEQEQ